MNEYTERLKNLVDQLFTCQFHFDAFADENLPIGMELRSVCEANYAIIVRIEGLITEIEKAPLETCCPKQRSWANGQGARSGGSG